MDWFERRRRLRLIMNSKITLVILLVLFLVVAKSTWALYGKNKEAAMKKDSIYRESKMIEDRRVFLEKEMVRLKSDQGIEELLRQKFNIKKDGEEVLVFIDQMQNTDEEEKVALKTRFNAFWANLKDFFR